MEEVKPAEGGAALAPTNGPVQEPQAIPLKTSKRPAKRGVRHRLKRYAWRLTGSYVWFRFFLVFFGGHDFFTSAEARWMTRLADSLSSVGFAPANTASLPIISKVGWVLVITGFSLLEMLGLVVYIMAFPVSALFLLLFRKELAEYVEATKKNRQPPRPKETTGIPVMALCTFALLGWFVLYGESIEGRPVAAGALLTGALFFVLAYRSIVRTVPPANRQSAPLWWLEKIGAGVLSTMESKKPPKTKTEAAVLLKLYRPMRWVFTQFALLTRAPRGQSRISLFALGEYAFSLIVLSLSSVLFWALAVRAATAPATIPLQAHLYFSVSHFLPGLNPPPLEVAVPLWARIGPGVTAWVLFVLYVGVATSVLPGRLKAYAERLSTTYKLLRTVSLVLSAYVAKLDHLRTTLPHDPD